VKLIGARVPCRTLREHVSVAEDQRQLEGWKRLMAERLHEHRQLGNAVITNGQHLQGACIPDVRLACARVERKCELRIRGSGYQVKAAVGFPHGSEEVPDRVAPRVSLTPWRRIGLKPGDLGRRRTLRHSSRWSAKLLRQQPASPGAAGNALRQALVAMP
jgi:hypothetical protein